jgi:hypothetical protein
MTLMNEPFRERIRDLINKYELEHRFIILL